MLVTVGIIVLLKSFFLHLFYLFKVVAPEELDCFKGGGRSSQPDEVLGPALQDEGEGVGGGERDEVLRRTTLLSSLRF